MAEDSILGKITLKASDWFGPLPSAVNSWPDTTNHSAGPVVGVHLGGVLLHSGSVAAADASGSMRRVFPPLHAALLPGG